MSDPSIGPGSAWPPPVYQAPPPGLPYDRDSDHLQLLSIFFYIWGGLAILGSCFFIIYIFMGMQMTNPQFVPTTPGQPAMPASFGHMFTLMGIAGLVIGWLLGGSSLYAGRCLARRQHMFFIIAVAAVSCLSIPFGTILGVITLVVLNRPTVKALFSARGA